MMQCPQHWGGKWDQLLTARRTDPSVLAFNCSLTSRWMHASPPPPPQPQFSLHYLQIHPFFRAPLCMLLNITDFSIICGVQQVAWDKRFTGNNLSEGPEVSRVSRHAFKKNKNICEEHFIIHSTEAKRSGVLRPAPRRRRLFRLEH